MIFLLKTRYVRLGAGQKRSGHSVEAPAAVRGRCNLAKMSPRTVLALVAIACLSQAVARPVRRTLNFNMFVLKPRQGAPDRTLLATDGMSRFGPLMEYLVQRVQGMLSVRLPPENGLPENGLPESARVPIADAAENEIDVQESKMPGVVVRPSRTKPGTYEVEIDVVVDDGQPDDKPQ